MRIVKMFSDAGEPSWDWDPAEVDPNYTDLLEKGTPLKEWVAAETVKQQQEEKEECD